MEAAYGSGAWFGAVSYTHGGGIDRPLAITKNDTTVIPHQNWRGQFSRGTYPNGVSSDCVNSSQTTCSRIAWPGYRTTAWHESKGVQVTSWWGGLVDGMRDGSGQMYMRNRYYDPATGQFTQPDPIGIAGGMNSYGFAAGDPVSYNDPYGLCAFGIGPDAAYGRCGDGGDVDTGSDGCPPRCRITGWGGGLERGFGHVKMRHLGGAWGDQFVNMTDAALRHVLAQTVESSNLVFARVVNGELRLTFERR